MSTRPEFYSGRGAIFGDFNFGKPSLSIMFNELMEINEEHALEFVNLVTSFKNLNATNFLTSFYLFAINGFSMADIEISEMGYNLDVDGDEHRDLIALATIVSAFRNSQKSDDTAIIKEHFINGLPEKVLENPKIQSYVARINNNYTKEKTYY